MSTTLTNASFLSITQTQITAHVQSISILKYPSLVITFIQSMSTFSTTSKNYLMPTRKNLSVNLLKKTLRASPYSILSSSAWAQMATQPLSFQAMYSFQRKTVGSPI